MYKQALGGCDKSFSTDHQMVTSGCTLSATAEIVNQGFGVGNFLPLLQRKRSNPNSFPGEKIHYAGSASIWPPEVADVKEDSTGSEEQADADTDSDAWTIDEGPCELPEDLPSDTHIANSREWLANLCSLEQMVVNSSSIFNYWHLQAPICNLELSQSLQVLTGANQNYQRLLAGCYCADAFIVIITNQQRRNVACLVRIPGDEILTIQRLLASGNTALCLDKLRNWGFHQSHANIQAIKDENDRLVALASVIAKFIDLAIVSFSGAHLEPFDEKFLGVSNIAVSLCDSLVLHRRSLSCLDECLGRQPVWVFEDVGPERPNAWYPMYVSTTISDLHDIWGPVWVSLPVVEGKEERKSQPPWSGPVVSYNIGRGRIIPWQQQRDEPEAIDNEFLAHWTTNECDLNNVSAFPPSSREPRFLIGATRLSVNESCGLKVDQWTLSVRSFQRLEVPGTRASKREQDAQTFTIGYNAFGVTAGYQEQWKRRSGSTLKDRALVSWINEPEARNPSIMADHLAVEISACSGNARRQRLIRILACQTIRNYLRSIMLIWDHTEAEELYFRALKDRNARAFEKLYLARPDLRGCFGRAVARSLDVLLHTGVDSNFCLRALWSPTLQAPTNSLEQSLLDAAPSLRLWSVAFPHESTKWSGLLIDTINSCTVAVVTDQCLVLRTRRCSEKFGCKNNPLNPYNKDDTVQKPKPQSLLETALCVNDKAHIPCSLHKTSGGRWDLKRGAEFDLGASGRLRFLGPVHGTRGLLMKWSAPGAAFGITQWFRERLMKGGPMPYHWERIDDFLGLESVQVHFISS
ncbi:uncharacterized protein BDW70DRAFT_165323 [Aspergillus foveolatus]|uniref:uncharacterized protein n=1 Tax=Aspergillus foveolatus TaxID=210207 RepID=UPI003CCE2758